jgi:hypothetical protein
VSLKVIPKVPCDFEIVSKASLECTLEKITYESNGKQKQKFDVLELVNVFNEARKNLIFMFILDNAGFK